MGLGGCLVTAGVLTSHAAAQLHLRERLAMPACPRCVLPKAVDLRARPQVAIEPKTKADLEKMGAGLAKLAQEDPSFHFSREEETNQTVIEGMGELHLEIIVDRLRREFNVRRGGVGRWGAALHWHSV